MCDVLDKVENRGIKKGIAKGESRRENKKIGRAHV